MRAEDWLRLNALKPESCPLDRQLWLWRLGFVGGAFLLAVWLGAGAALMSVRDEPPPPRPSAPGVRVLGLESFEQELHQRLEQQVELDVQSKLAQRSDD